jgi:hypothetical protein
MVRPLRHVQKLLAASHAGLKTGATRDSGIDNLIIGVDN